MDELKIYTVEFIGMYPVGNCLVLCAYSLEQANEIAKETILHTNEFTVKQFILDEPKVIEYVSGNY